MEEKEKDFIEYVKLSAKEKRKFQKVFKDIGYPNANVLVDLSTDLLFIDLNGNTDLDDYEAFFKAQLKAVAVMRMIQDNDGLAKKFEQAAEEAYENNLEFKEISLENLANPKYNNKNKA